MKIEYFHASKFGNGAMVAEEFNKQMAAKGVMVDVQHIREARPDRLPTADLYVFSSPGRMGRPIGGMRRFLKKVRLSAGTRYAILTTEMAPQPDKKTGRIPTEEELARWQRVRPIMNEILRGAGLVNVAEDKVLVTGLKGPLEEGWQKKVAAFAARTPITGPSASGAHRRRRRCAGGRPGRRARSSGSRNHVQDHQQGRSVGGRVVVEEPVAWWRRSWLIPAKSWMTTTPGHGPSPDGVVT
jgi:menaquinone-dependent protoporphyrinogen IX oxidase